MPTDDNDRPAWDLEPLPLGANGHSGNPWRTGANSTGDESTTRRVRVMKRLPRRAIG